MNTTTKQAETTQTAEATQHAEEVFQSAINAGCTMDEAQAAHDNALNPEIRINTQRVLEEIAAAQQEADYQSLLAGAADIEADPQQAATLESQTKSALFHAAHLDAHGDHPQNIRNAAEAEEVAAAGTDAAKVQKIRSKWYRGSKMEADHAAAIIENLRRDDKRTEKRADEISAEIYTEEAASLRAILEAARIAPEDAEQITAAMVDISDDGEYSNIWLTESSRPYEIGAKYRTPEYYHATGVQEAHAEALKEDAERTEAIQREAAAVEAYNAAIIAGHTEARAQLAYHDTCIARIASSARRYIDELPANMRAAAML